MTDDTMTPEETPVEPMAPEAPAMPTEVPSVDPMMTPESPAMPEETPEVPAE